MAEPLNVAGLAGLSVENPDICTIEASVVTGFEPMAQEEIKDVLGSEGTCHRGRVIFDLPVARVKEVLGLKTVNNLWVFIGHTSKFEYPDGSEEQLEALADYATKLDWSKALKAWQIATEYKGQIYEELPVVPVPTQNEEKPKFNNLPSFRCTCYRSGTNHKYKSTEVQMSVGGRINDTFHWEAKMKNYDMEVVINCDVDQVYMGVALNNSSLFNRSVTHYGPCTLKPTICAAMIRLAQVKPGDIVLDPMAGGGSIPLEGCQMDSHGFYLAGEMHDMAIDRTMKNMRDLSTTMNLDKERKMDGLRWDCLNPCLRDNSVDVIVSDLPFGKRSGSKADNKVLYPQTLLAMARLVRPDTGRAVLLTQDKNSMFKCLGRTGQVAKYWKIGKHFSCNIGGLAALIFLFQRTSESPVAADKS